MISIGELLPGSDADFVTNAYLAALGRWPDAGGFEHHLAAIAGQPEQRAEMLRRMHASEEGQRAGCALSPDAGPVPLEQALAAQLRLRTEVLRHEIAALREAVVAHVAGSALLAEVSGLGVALSALGVEMRERMAALEATVAGKLPAPPQLSPAVSLDYVNEVIEAAEAQWAHRLRSLEKRLTGA
ncbi:DUF4214 domain-containing protein [Sediminicoccus sp. KRV36]|uniref:DUF4214 domain-containing protein n=1 Tax=Sediminicoccus sp. KRV36 TaxID=3133721 RepID=UPI00200F12E4|nr:DUF4214 domain-containing protein [Sediminicoccus rosea]UPY38151.1 DUF4214 domain-containing protein [Sediminicoccus rosea]